MCLTNKFKVDSEKVKAYKIFHLSEDNELYSAFYAAYNLAPYKTGKQVNYCINACNDEESYFYALNSEEDAIALINEKRKNPRERSQYWFLQNSLVILPVIIKPVYVGFLQSSHESQTPRSYFSYMSKELTIALDNDVFIQKAERYNEFFR